jgi:predicted amidohydrolase YtcJ
MSSEHLTRRIKALGANVSVNPYYVHHRASINVPHMGKDRAHTAARLKQCLDMGVVTALHTDTPVAPPRPLEEMYIAVTRLNESGEICAPSERITVEQALRMKTVDAAYVLGLDGLLGTIEPGKFADFTVLYENPLKVKAEHLRDIKIWGTVVGGKKYRQDHKWSLKTKVPEDLSFFRGIIWLFATTAHRGRGSWSTRWVWKLLGRWFAGMSE